MVYLRLDVTEEETNVTKLIYISTFLVSFSSFAIKGRKSSARL